MRPNNDISINVAVIAIAVIYAGLIVAWILIADMTIAHFLILAVAATIFAGIVGSAFSRNADHGDDDQL